ncbi:unnamed protein product [Psylliodes chrysocephalus]|uniref:Uncharacterized protein n=1 Tax=Psylliodes chrysocephalus TaxID=3402493 RepID=A0A9P0D925_9CUCU|nr:unnamed protein product [Psylliodes chrysocephala]
MSNPKSNQIMTSISDSKCLKKLFKDTGLLVTPEIKAPTKNYTTQKKKQNVVVSSDSSESEEEVQYADSEDDMDPEEDVDCPFCLESFSSDKAGEKWEFSLTEPPLLKQVSEDDLQEIVKDYSNYLVITEIMQLPCHTQAIVRAVKLVTVFFISD